MSSLNVENMTDSEKNGMMKKLKSRRSSIMFSGIIGYVLLNIVRSSSGIIMPTVIEQYALTAAQAGLFGAIFNYTYAAVSIPIGGLIDIVKARKIMLISYASMIAGMIVFSYSPNYTWLIISRGLMGFGSAGFFPAFTKTVASWASTQNFPKYSGLVMSAASLGTVLSSTPLTILITGVGMKNSMLYLAAGCVIVFFIMIFIIKSEPADCGLLTEDQLLGNKVQETKKFKNTTSGILTVLKQPRVWFIVSAVLVSNVGGAGTQWAATYMRMSLGFEALTASNVILVVSIIAIAGGILQGYISTKYSIKTSMVVYMSLILTSLILNAIFLPTLTPFTAGLFMVPQRLGNGMAIACCQSMFRKNVTTKYYGTCVGLYNAIGWAVGSGVFTQVFAGFIDTSYSVESFQRAFLVTLIVTAVLAVIGLFSKEEVIPALANKNDMVENNG